MKFGMCMVSSPWKKKEHLEETQLQKRQAHLVLWVDVDGVNSIHAVHEHLEHVLSV